MSTHLFADTSSQVWSPDFKVTWADAYDACATVAELWGGLGGKLSVTNLILAVILPMSSTVNLVYQQWIEHGDAADRLDRLRERVERIWRDAVADPNKTSLEDDRTRGRQGFHPPKAVTVLDCLASSG